MSLVTLTFGAKSKESFNATPHAAISTPEDRMRERMAKNGATGGVALVRKACRFFSLEEVYLVAEVKDGFLAEGMTATLNGRNVEVLGVESKYGNAAQKGMTVGITVRGVAQSDFSDGTELMFESQ
ncbi:MAG: hypothetical protein NUV67_05700 [archaeon]|nr:hypothetical protein [archaeon]